MELLPEQIARVAHEANRAYCMATGDHSIPAWDSAPAWQKESVMLGVAAALANPQKTPQESHAEWMQHKVETGWKYGPVKRPEVLEHPYIVPYEQLPDVQRGIDLLFLAIVRVLGKLATVSVGEVAAAVSMPVPEHSEDPVVTSAGEIVPGEATPEVVSHKKSKRR